MNPAHIKRFPDYYESAPREEYTYVDESGADVIVQTNYMFGALARNSGERGGGPLPGDLGRTVYRRCIEDGHCFYGYRKAFIFAFTPDDFQYGEPLTHEQEARPPLEQLFGNCPLRWWGVKFGTKTVGNRVVGVSRYVDLRLVAPKHRSLP